jgi:ketosteroid isomerase-like protein
MRRTSILVAVAFLAGVGAGGYVQSARTATLVQKDMRAADTAAIEKLHRADVEATLTQDQSYLTALWSEDAINLGFPGPPVVGIKAMGEAYAKMKVAYPEFRVLKYEPVITDVQIVGEWALEVGTFAATYKMSAKDEPVSVNDKGMRLLKRQPDGTWKFALVGMK